MDHQPPTVREMLLELQHEISARLHRSELQSQELQGRLSRIEEALSRFSTDVATAKQRTDDLDLMRYEIRQIQEQLAAGETSRRDLGLEAVKTIIGLVLGAIAAVLLGGGFGR